MFITRAISSVVLVAIALVTLIMGGEVLLGLTVLISIIGYLELCRATKVCPADKKFNDLEAVGILGILVYYAMIYINTNSDETIYILMPFIGVFMLSMLLYVLRFPKYSTEQVMGNVFHVLYAPLMLSFIYLCRELQYGSYFVWLILLSSWGSDTCAYLVGICIGKKKIFPVLSPKKSLEGCIGGVVGAGLLGFLYGIFVMERIIPDVNIAGILMIICMVGSVMSQIGDLAASAIKRNHNIKDYGRLIPGHGGIMDRFDSVTVTAPMIYFLTILMIGVK